MNHNQTYRLGPHEYDPVFSRDLSERGVRTGGYRHCQMEGCRGLRIGIRWPDGRISWPCTMSLAEGPSGGWKII